MGVDFGSGAVVVTALSTVRTGGGSLRLGEAPRGAVGWFHSRPDRPDGPQPDELRAHARLFPEAAGLVALLGGGDAAFFHGKGRALEPVPAVESAELPLEPARFAEAVRVLGLVRKDNAHGDA